MSSLSKDFTNQRQLSSDFYDIPTGTYRPVYILTNPCFAISGNIHNFWEINHAIPSHLGHILYEIYTYKSVLVRNIVGQLELVEGDDLAHPLLASRRGVRMDVHALGHFRVGLSRDHPSRVVELVAAVVNGNDINKHDVLGTFVEARDFHFERRKHTSATRKQNRYSLKEIIENSLPISIITMLLPKHRIVLFMN